MVANMMIQRQAHSLGVGNAPGSPTIKMERRRHRTLVRQLRNQCPGQSFPFRIVTQRELIY